MCVQCAAGATTAIVSGTAATGLRAVAAAYRPGWLTTPMMRALTALCVLGGLLGAGLLAG